jgi:ribose-phosphate pyrophosphokinase
MVQRQLRLFSLAGALGQTVAAALGVQLASHEIRQFEDGEYKVRPLDNVDGHDVFLLECLHGQQDASVHDRLCRLLMFVGALKDAGAARVTVVAPYLCYARKDRRTKLSDPLSLRYIAQMFEVVGTDVMMVLDVHNPAAFENAFRCRTVTLTAAGIFAAAIKPAADERLCVVSPDPGGVKRAELFRERLEASRGVSVAKGFVDKRRSGGVLSGETFVGDADGATVLIVDDLISTGHTMVRAAEAARKAGARRVFAMASHGLFTQQSLTVLADPAIDRLLITDSVPVPLLDAALGRKTEIVSCAGLAAGGIRRLHEGSSLVEYLAL